MRNFLILLSAQLMLTSMVFAQEIRKNIIVDDNKNVQLNEKRVDIIQTQINRFDYVAKPDNFNFFAESIDSKSHIYTDNRAPFDLLFRFQGAQMASPGIATDGTHIYTSCFHMSGATKGVFTRHDMDGSNPVNFTIPYGDDVLNGVVNMTYDGEYFWISNGLLWIWKVDFTNQTLVDSVWVFCPGMDMVRNIEYDPTLDNGNGGFWVGDYSDIAAVNMSGFQVVPKVSLGWDGPSGIGFDPYSDIMNPCLWLFTQMGVPGSGAAFKQWDIKTRAYTGVVYNVIPDISDIHNTGTSQGATAYNNGEGKFILLANLATSPGGVQRNIVLGYELCTIPVPEAPAPVTDLTVTPGVMGALNALIEWTNPDITETGDNLTHLSAIKVFISGVLVHTDSDPEIGGTGSYNVTVGNGGSFTITVVAENIFGASLPKGVNVWIGEDAPAAPAEVILVRNGMETELEWTPVTTGLHEGYFTLAGIVYDVYRYPDELLVSANQIGTTFSETIVNQGYYYYRVIAKNDIGVGGFTDSNIGIFCQTKTLPFHEGFDNNGTKLPVCWENEFVNYDTPWRIVDGGQGIPFGTVDGEFKAYIRSVLINTQTTKLVTPPIDISGADNPVLTFWHGQFDFGGQDTLRIYYKISEYGDWILLEEYKNNVPDWAKRTIPLPNPTDNYFIAFEAIIWGHGVHLDAINIFDAAIVTGTVTDGDDPISGAKVEIIETEFFDNTNEEGKYTIINIGQSTYDFKVSKLGYYDEIEQITINQNITNKDFVLTSLPLYSVSGKVIGNDAPDGLEDVIVTLSGYNSYSTTTDAFGNYTFTDVYGIKTYTITAKLSGYSTYTGEVAVNNNVTHNITLNEIAAPVKNLTAVDNDTFVTITWEAPSGTPEIFRYDSGIMSSQVGFDGVAPKGVIGSCHRAESEIEKIQWFLTDHSPNPATSVNIYIFDLDATGKPKNNILFSALNVSTQIMQWCEYELPIPILAPNGFFMALSRPVGSFLSLGTTTPTEEWQFQPNTHYYCSDYEIAGFTALAPPTLNVNLMIRSEGYTFGKAAQFGYNDHKSMQGYNVYRLLDGQQNDETLWKSLTSGNSQLSFIDNEWEMVEAGAYRWAVIAEYSAGVKSVARFTNPPLAKNMEVAFTINLTTNSGDPVTGAIVTLTNLDNNPDHVYTEIATEKTVVFPKVWKGIYNISATLVGFNNYLATNITVDENGLSHNAEMKEIIKPVYNPIAKEEGDYVLITWKTLPEINTWINYCINDNIVRTLGWDQNAGNDMTATMRFLPTDLQNLGIVSGHSISKVAIGVGTELNRVNVMEIKIWEGGTSVIDPGQLVYTQSITNFSSFIQEAMNEVVLTTPFVIDATKELRIGYRVVNTAGFPLGGDAGPHVNGKGDLLYCADLGGWVECHSLQIPGGWDRNFSIKAYITDGSKTGFYGDKRLTGFSVYRLVKGQPEEQWTILSPNATVLTYNDNAWSFLSAGTYQWAIKANYSSGQSEAELTNELEKGVGIKTNILSDFVLYPNPFVNEINIKNSSMVKRVSITNAYGQNINEANFDGKSISTEKLVTGVYFVVIEYLTGEKAVYKMVKK